MITVNIKKARKVLVLLCLLISPALYSQTLTQTFTDRCTGETQVFTVAFGQSTTIFFYNKSATFTYTQFANGEFRAWLEETYYWWSQLNPCSTAQAENTVAQQTTQQATQAATTAAANVATAVPATPTPEVNVSTPEVSTPTPAPATTTTNETSTQPTTTDTPATTEGSSTPEPASSDTGSSDSSPNTETESSPSDGGGESSGGTEDNSEAPAEETQTEETSSEETSSEESKEEVKEEKQEESKEEESSESEETSEESKEEEKKEEKKEKKKKKQNSAPPVLASNLTTMQMVDGTFSTAASFGVSQSSLTGTDSYNANLMVWSNLKQFSLSAGKSHIFFNYDKEVPIMIQGLEWGHKMVRGSIMMIQSVSANVMYIFGTKVVTAGISNVYLGQKDNFLKGFVGGYALNFTSIFIEKDISIMPSATFFGTKPFPKERWTISPMLALSFNPISYTSLDNTVGLNKYFSYIVGSNFDFNITQRFKANLGFNTVGNTNPIIPMTVGFTIGSRFSF